MALTAASRRPVTPLMAITALRFQRSQGQVTGLTRARVRRATQSSARSRCMHICALACMHAWKHGRAL